MTEVKYGFLIRISVLNLYIGYSFRDVFLATALQLIEETTLAVLVSFSSAFPFFRHAPS